MSALTNVGDYCRAIQHNVNVVKLVGFLDRYIEDPAQFSKGKLVSALSLIETCKTSLEELQAILSKDFGEMPEIDLSHLAHDIKARIDYLGP